MRRLLRRLARDIVLLPLTALVVFELVNALPARVESDAKVQVVTETARALRFTEPWRKLVGGELLGQRDRHGGKDLLEALLGSMRVGTMALGFALLIGVGFAALRWALRRRAGGHALELLPALAYGTPAFLLALIVAKWWGIPHGPEEYAGTEPIMALVMAVWPGVFMGTVLSGALDREARMGYFATALAKGRRPATVLLLHALPNALPALIDALPPVATTLLAGSFVAEKLFNVKYFGLIYVEAASSGEGEVVIVATTMFAAILVGVSALADLLRVIVDPRERST
jgi:oligopeptide transport system permease protein